VIKDSSRLVYIATNLAIVQKAEADYFPRAGVEPKPLLVELTNEAEGPEGAPYRSVDFPEHKATVKSELILSDD